MKRLCTRHRLQLVQKRRSMNSTPKPPGTHGHNQSTGLWQTRGPRCRRSGSSGTPSPRGPVRRRPWGRTHWPGRHTSPGVSERCGGAWWPRAGAVDRAGRGREPTACLVVWTTGFSGEWWVPVWPPAAPGDERSESFGLDVKNGRGLGRKNGRRGRHVAHHQRPIINAGWLTTLRTGGLPRLKRRGEPLPHHP